ncbi:unnamed protein product [Bemisia tabaci]|uniref:Ionotropic receptor n=1 Tax=Bemisia tabaci TaxID=7038 RepID=A0A9P0A8T8_BEMTA|nr:unnamed protein product [Bemisia tabaci]
MTMYKSIDLSQGHFDSNGTLKHIRSSLNITLILSTLLIFLLSRITTANLGVHFKDHLTLRHNNDLALKICREIVHLSKNQQFHIVDLRGNPSETTLGQDLHESSISTVSISQHSKFSLFPRSQNQKNLIVFLTETNTIFSLILATASHRDQTCNYPSQRIPTNFSYTCSSFYAENNVRGELPNYCVTFDSVVGSEQVNTTCQYRLHLTPAELNGKSPLTNHSFSLTRGLYSHNIWNYRNYIVFMVDQKSWRRLTSKQESPGIEESRHSSSSTFSSEDVIESRNLIFLFDVFWRFFRGQRTTICFKKQCIWYDRIERSLLYYGGSKNERYFDFNFRVFEDQTSTVFDYKVGLGLALRFSRDGFTTPEIYSEVFNLIFGEDVECFILDEKYTPYGDAGLQQDLDLIIYEGGHVLEESEISQFHLTPSFDSVHYCFLAPRRGFMPQYLVVIKCFSPPVWLAIITAIATSWLMQWVFQRFQVAHFAHFYSDAEVSALEESPAFLAIFSYFLNGSPPTLLLGRFLTGKICFLVFTFFNLIIGTVLQSGMTTLLSKYVRYSDIETLEELEQSGLYIQTPMSIEALSDILGHSEHAPLKHQLTDSRYNYERLVAKLLSEYDPDGSFCDRSPNSTNVSDNCTEKISELEKNVVSIAGLDAYLARLPYSLLRAKNRVTPRGFLTVTEIEFHLIDECLTVYPISYLIVENSILTELFDKKMSQLIESGYTARCLFPKATEYYLESSPQTYEGEGSLRPFSMIDLQLAFISLGVGLVVSFLVFIIELYYGWSK